MLLALSAILVYFVPVEFNRILFLIFLIPMWKSRKDYFWFAFLFVLLDSPGGLFSGGGLENPFRLPVYNIAPQISFSFQEICVFLLLLKGIAKKGWPRYRSFIFRKQYTILFAYLLLLILISIILGASFQSQKNTYKMLIVISLYLSAIFIFSVEKEIVEFFKAIFPFAIVALLLQLYGLVYHQQLVALFEPGRVSAQGVLNPDEFMRPIELAVVNLLCFFGSLLYLDNKVKYFNNRYLILINVSSYVSIFMTATRSWFIGLTVMYILYFFINMRKVIVNIKNVTIGIVIVIAILTISPAIKKQTDQSLTRLQTIEMLYRGDMTAGNTLDRFTRKGPIVLEGFFKSTILFGAGFSDLYYEYGNGHVGFHNILLHSGIIGFLMLLGFALLLMAKPYKLVKKAKIDSYLNSILRNMPLLMPAILLINSSTQFWGFTVDEPQRVMLLAFFICISNIYMKKYIQAVLICRNGKLKEL